MQGTIAAEGKIYTKDKYVINELSELKEYQNPNLSTLLH